MLLLLLGAASRREEISGCSGSMAIMGEQVCGGGVVCGRHCRNRGSNKTGSVWNNKQKLPEDLRGSNMVMEATGLFDGTEKQRELFNNDTVH